MLEHILNFPDYVKEGYSLGKNFKVRGKINNVLVCGMGGSGISGFILKDYINHLPVCINQDYDIPKFVNKKTLAVIISYSGNTEETLSAYEKIKKKTKKKIIISSGGLLGEEKNVVKVPKGLPPRYSLPFLFFSMLSVLNNSKIVKKDFDLDEIVRNLKSLDPKNAESFAGSLIGHIPLVYAPQGYGSVAYRWQTQFNENSKMFAHSQVFPEHNHNEIEMGLTDRFKTIMLRDPETHEKINKRMDIISENPDVESINLLGNSKISRMFYGILFGDFTTYYLALKRSINPGEQKKIEDFKKKMKE